MRFATVSSAGSTLTVVVDADGSARVVQPGDVATLLEEPDWRERADAATVGIDLDAVTLLPVIPRPEKIICIGLNYRSHIEEMGREAPTHPTLFAKYWRSLIGPNDPIELPAASEKVDYEAELAVIVGRTVRHATVEDAAAAIAGYSVLNDVTARDWQRRTEQWLQGKTWERTTPLGPWLVTADELDPAGLGRPDVSVRCEVNDDVVQDARTSDLVFSPADLVAYASTVITLVPGDVIATGTPGGVGAARTPPRFLGPGDVVRTSIEGIGSCTNPCQAVTT
jgi:acylpyruvate hydrolase